MQRVIGHRALIERAAAALAAQPGRRLEEPGLVLKASAVAVLLVDVEGATWVPLIVRGATAPTHSGQIALPGGGYDLSDLDLVETARREAHEELGVPRDAPRVLGTLDDVPTPTGYAITPVVAELDASIVLAPDRREVADHFLAPLALFYDHAGAEQLGTRTWQGTQYTMRAYHHGPHRIWGATARILEALVELVGGPPRE